MPEDKFELTKSVQARKLNKRSGLPMNEWTTIPFGALISDLQEDRNLFKFTYLGEPYNCEQAIMASALKGLVRSRAAFEEETPAEPGPALPELSWTLVRSSHIQVRRAKVPGGWLIASGSGGIAFYPDPEHAWDGASLP